MLRPVPRPGRSRTPPARAIGSATPWRAHSPWPCSSCSARKRERRRPRKRSPRGSGGFSSWQSACGLLYSRSGFSVDAIFPSRCQGFAGGFLSAMLATCDCSPPFRLPDPAPSYIAEGPWLAGGFRVATLATFARSLPVPLDAISSFGGTLLSRIPEMNQECPRRLVDPPHRLGSPVNGVEQARVTLRRCPRGSNGEDRTVPGEKRRRSAGLLLPGKERGGRQFFPQGVPVDPQDLRRLPLVSAGRLHDDLDERLLHLPEREAGGVVLALDRIPQASRELPDPFLDDLLQRRRGEVRRTVRLDQFPRHLLPPQEFSRGEDGQFLP